MPFVLIQVFSSSDAWVSLFLILLNGMKIKPHLTRKGGQFAILPQLEPADSSAAG